MSRQARRVSFISFAVSVTLALSSTISAAFPRDPLCAPLKAFAASVKPHETREFQFHTSWGQGFQDSDGFSLFAKRCDHGGYAPAKAACDALLENGSAEFPGLNALRVIACLSPGTRFGRQLSLERLDLALPYGTDQRGSEVTIRLDHDPELGGEVLGIGAKGY